MNFLNQAQKMSKDENKTRSLVDFFLVAGLLKKLRARILPARGGGEGDVHSHLAFAGETG
jgi:hypothetical protein